MSHEVVRTRGGLMAMRSTEAGEVMHPGVGPLAEAEALYVRQSRLGDRLRAAGDPVTVFDIGLGAGSNALAARSESERLSVDVARLVLVSFERDLGALTLALDHGSAFGLEGEAAAAARALLRDGRHETARTSWRLERGDLVLRLQDIQRDEGVRADITFWDPFSPRSNPALWTIAAFSAIRQVAGRRGTLFTYSASTATRVALLLAGWAVGVGDPIGDKAETTAAAVSVDDLARPLGRGWLSRLHRPDAPLPSDAPSDTARRVSACPQFG